MTQKSPANSRDLEMLNAPAIDAHFPVKFANGKEWTTFAGHCKGCNGTLATKELHGFVTRPIPSVAVVEAIGVCPHCNMGTRFFCRLHDDLSITALQKDGKWGRWQARPTWLGRFQKAWRRFVGKASTVQNSP